jgi:hypothetical protein
VIRKYEYVNYEYVKYEYATHCNVLLQYGSRYEWDVPYLKYPCAIKSTALFRWSKKVFVIQSVRCDSDLFRPELHAIDQSLDGTGSSVFIYSGKNEKTMLVRPHGYEPVDLSGMYP